MLIGTHKWGCDPIVLCTVFYNFCKIHKTLRVTLAMEAGIFDTVRDAK